MIWGALEGLGDEEYAWEPVPGSWLGTHRLKWAERAPRPPLRRDDVVDEPELIATGAEITLLRDLHRSRPD